MIVNTSWATSGIEVGTSRDIQLEEGTRILDAAMSLGLRASWERQMQKALTLLVQRPDAAGRRA